jgi:hypothetical protein
VSADLRDALAADRALRRRAAREAIPVAGGIVIRHAELQDVHYLNAVLLDAGPGALDPDEVAAAAERWQDDLGHRHVVFDDADAGERAAAVLERDGWERGRTVLMAFAGDPAAVAPDRRAREISEPEMEALQLANLRELAPEGGARAGLAARLLATQRRLRATTPSRCFGAGEPAGELGSMCTLFLDDDVGGRRVAMVTDVGTRVAHRERGLARAVVLAAVARAGAWGADLIVVGADADDWPQLMYARLGFAPVGRQVALTRRLPSPSGSVSGGV